MPDVGLQLREYIESVARPITLDEVTSPLVRLSPPGSRRRPWLRYAVAVTVVAVALAAVLAMIARSSAELPVGPSVDTFRGIWPQRTPAEAEAAQAAADAGNPEFTWQRGNGVTVGARFVESQLGWGGSMPLGQGYVPNDLNPAHDWDAEAVLWEFMRCGEGENPLYPSSPCAPTISDTQFEVVEITLEQLVRRGEAGLWFVTSWTDITYSRPEVSVQPVPLEEALVRSLLAEFLEARLAGEGAKRYVGRLTNWNDPVELSLYGTAGGSPFVSYEIVNLRAEWPVGSYTFEIHLTAADGTVVRESLYRATTDTLAARQIESDLFFGVTERPPP